MDLSTTSQFIGLTIEAAELKAEKLGITIRIGSIDGVGQTLTNEVSDRRLTVAIKEGKITGVQVK